MFYKNLRFYFFKEAIPFNEERLEEALDQYKFQEYDGISDFTIGWVPPIKLFDNLLFDIRDYMLIALKIESPVVPGEQVAKVLDARVQKLKDKGELLSKADIEAIKIDVVAGLRKKAYTTSKVIHAYIDTANRLLVIDSASAGACEEFIKYFKACIDCGPIVLPDTSDSVGSTLWTWATGKAAEKFIVEDEFDLYNPKDKTTIKQKGLAVDDSTITEFLDCGMVPSRMALEYDTKVQFVLTDDLSLKRIKFSDYVIESAHDGNDDEEALAEATVLVMTSEFGTLIDDLSQALGVKNKFDSD